MGILDNLKDTVTGVSDRAKFEFDKFQRVTRLQGELGDLKKQSDARRLEFADRAMELYRAGQIQSASLAEIMRAVESLQRNITIKEEEYRNAQADDFMPPPAPPSPPAPQTVPVSVEPVPQGYAPPPPTYSAPPPPAPTTGTKPCPTCSFRMPVTAIFCPSCGTRVGV